MQKISAGMRRERRVRFPGHRFQRKPLVSDPGMHQGTCVTHVPWCMPVWLTRGGGENVPGIPCACATRNFTYPVRGPCSQVLQLLWRSDTRRFFCACPIFKWVTERCFKDKTPETFRSNGLTASEQSTRVHFTFIDAICFDYCVKR